jgi:hypothetical protein
MTRLTAVPTVTDLTPREMSSMLRPLLDICAGDGKVYRDDRTAMMALAAIKMAN